MNTITINGKTYNVPKSEEQRSLMRFLREDLLLTGTKNGCEIGMCGSCTVLVDGKALRACKLPLKRIQGKKVLTIEGLKGVNGDLHPIQQSFVDAGAIQCGFCTPGMVMAVYGLLKTNPTPDRDEIRRSLRGNTCRCTGYQQIFEAVELAAMRIRDMNLEL